MTTVRAAAARAAHTLAPAVRADTGPIKDEAQVRLLARALWTLSQQDKLAPLFDTPASPVTTEEGWILGAEHEAQLNGALRCA